jgi:hypothetical protein
LPRIPALRNMMSNISDYDARQSCHSKNLTEKMRERTMDRLILV